MRKLLAPALLLTILFYPRAGHAADKSRVLADRLKAAVDLTSFDTPAGVPWHWKMDVTVWDVNGKNPQQAGIEVWSAGDKMRTVESLGAGQITTIRSGDQVFRTDGYSPAFAQLELLLQQALHPIPEEILRSTTKFKVHSDSRGKIALDCIDPTLPAPHTDVIIMGLKLAYCVKKDTNTLAVTQTAGQVVYLREQIDTFQSKEAPISLKILFGSTLRLEAKTSKLEPYTPQQDDFTPGEAMHALTGPVEVLPADLGGLGLIKTPPSYPPNAKLNHVSGSVKFDAIIGTDGRVVSLQPEGSPDPDLLRAASDAVHGWVYRPLTICGLPFEMKTTITVNFNLSS